MFNYIDENLNEILQNKEDVLFLEPALVGKKRALFAFIKIDEGVYKKVQLTKEQSKMSFPFDPILHFFNGHGYFLSKDFMIFEYGWFAVNIAHLESFRYRPLDNKQKYVGVYATFNDGSATLAEARSVREFKKQGGIEKYIDALKKYKEYNEHYKTYEIIECYIDENSDIITVPELQKNENQEVKKLNKIKKIMC